MQVAWKPWPIFCLPRAARCLHSPPSAAPGTCCWYSWQWQWKHGKLPLWGRTCPSPRPQSSTCILTMFRIPSSRILQINAESRRLQDGPPASLALWARREDLCNRLIEHLSSHRFSSKGFQHKVCSKFSEKGFREAWLCGSKASFWRLAKKIPQPSLTKARIFLITKSNRKHFTPTVLLPQCGTVNKAAKYCLVLQDKETKTKQSVILTRTLSGTQVSQLLKLALSTLANTLSLINSTARLGKNHKGLGCI